MVSLLKLANTQVQPVRQKVVSEEPKVAQGLHQESKISLYELGYNGFPQSIAFVYPKSALVTEDTILQMNGRYSQPCQLITEKGENNEFRDVSPEELSRKFLTEVGMPSTFDLKHTFRGIEIKAHVFAPESKRYLEEVINAL